VAKTLHDYYIAKGFDAKLLVGHKKGDDPNVISLGEYRINFQRLKKLAGKLPRNLGFEYFYYPKFKRWLEQNSDWDIIHFHNIHSSYLPLNSVSIASRNSNVVWSLHDRWSLTGHCAQPIKCDKWMTNCFICPDLSIYPKIKFDSAWVNLLRKKWAYNNKNIHLVCPSRWMDEVLSKSILKDRDRTVILNGVLKQQHSHDDQSAAREKLNLNMEGKYALYVATGGLESPWRHGSWITEFARQNDPDVTTLVLGGRERIDKENMVFLPYIKDELPLYYQASDIFLFPAIVDNFPLVLLESLASGLPIITTDVAGCPEIVEDGVTGYVVAAEDEKGFMQRASSLIESVDTRRRFSENSVKRYLDKFRFEMMAEKYLDLYRQIFSS